jgi:hypothetical protein
MSIETQTMNREEVIAWLLKSDPAIRWQVLRDLLDTEESAYTLERRRLPQEGWCANLLSLQDKGGLWSGSLYNRKWVSTTYSLYLLKLLGLSPFHDQALLACDRLLEEGLYCRREIRFSRGQVLQDIGVTGLILSLCCYFGYHHDLLHGIAEHLASQQGGEGNWLPDGPEAPSAYTFETTLLVLEGLLQYGKRYSTPNFLLAGATAKGQDFLLKHNLYLDRGKRIKNAWTSFSFPPYWFYDVLTALDYFQRFGENRDKRIQTGIDLLMQKRNKEGTWNLGARHPGKTHFQMEQPGEPSRWNTLRALQVLKWWNGSGG